MWSHLQTEERQKRIEDVFLEYLVNFKLGREPIFTTTCNPLIIPTLQIRTFILQRHELTNPQPRAGLESRSIGDQMLCAQRNNAL